MLSRSVVTQLHRSLQNKEQLPRWHSLFSPTFVLHNTLTLHSRRLSRYITLSLCTSCLALTFNNHLLSPLTLSSLNYHPHLFVLLRHPQVLCARCGFRSFNNQHKSVLVSEQIETILPARNALSPPTTSLPRVTVVLRQGFCIGVHLNFHTNSIRLHLSHNTSSWLCRYTTRLLFTHTLSLV